MKTDLFISKIQEQPLVHAFVHHGREYIELRAYDDSTFTNGRILYGKDNLLGTAFADFVETDLSRMEHDIALLLEAVYSGSLDPDMILRIAEYWLSQSGLFATFAAELLILLSSRPKSQMDKIKELFLLHEQYRKKQQQASSIVDLLQYLTGGANAMIYLYRSGKGLEDYPKIHYGTISHELNRDFESVGYPSKNLSDDEFEEDIFNDSNTELEGFYSEFIVLEVLHANSLDDLFFFLLGKVLEECVKFRKCLCCGKWFAASQGSFRRYCTRPAPGSKKTCKEIGGQRLYDQRRIESPENREYVRSYKAHYARMRNGKMEPEEFKRWAKVARQYREYCTQGTISLQEFVTWLDQDKYFASKN